MNSKYFSTRIEHLKCLSLVDCLFISWFRFRFCFSNITYLQWHGGIMAQWWYVQYLYYCVSMYFITPFLVSHIKHANFTFAILSLIGINSQYPKMMSHVVLLFQITENFVYEESAKILSVHPSSQEFPVHSKFSIIFGGTSVDACSPEEGWERVVSARKIGTAVFHLMLSSPYCFTPAFWMPHVGGWGERWGFA